MRVTGVCVCVCAEKLIFSTFFQAECWDGLCFFIARPRKMGKKKGPAKNNKQEKMSRWELERKIGNTKTKQQTEGEMLKNTCQCWEKLTTFKCTNAISLSVKTGMDLKSNMIVK